METISAAENHTIHVTPKRWRMLYNDRPLAEATPQGLRYGSRFAATRRLSSHGVLDKEHILQVVLGWQHTDEAWHLGLIVAPPLAEKRNSRWVELVSWPDPDINVFEDLANDCGHKLSEAIGIPFTPITPQRIEPSPLRVLPELPLSFGDWTVKPETADNRQLVIERSSAWMMRRMWRIGWNILWMVVYLVLSLATMFADIALPNTGTLLPNPQWLPYIGLATTGLILCIILYNIFVIIREPNRIVVDGIEGSISAWKNQSRRWQVSAYDIHSIYVSEIVKKNDAPPATEYGELNLHIGGGDFKFLVSHPEPEDNANIDHPFGKISRSSEGIRELTRENAHTNLQVTAIYILEAMNASDTWYAWYDMRVK